MQTFDLLEFARERQANLASMRWFMVALGIVWLGFLLWFIKIQSGIQ